MTKNLKDLISINKPTSRVRVQKVINHRKAESVWSTPGPRLNRDLLEEYSHGSESLDTASLQHKQVPTRDGGEVFWLP